MNLSRKRNENLRVRRNIRLIQATTICQATEISGCADGILAAWDQVVARGRAKVVFGFDYVLEVYKLAHQRKFGYYTLPVLWDDQFTARFDSKLDRLTDTFVILGLRLEDRALGKNEAFAEALARGFERFVTFLGAGKLDAKAIREPLLHWRVSASM